MSCLKSGMKSSNIPWVCILAIAISLASTLITPLSLGLHHISPGEGPDELHHIDRIFFEYSNPDRATDLQRGFSEMGFSPAGQGHQAPLYYFMQKLVLSLFLDREEIGPFFDYQAGLRYSSDFYFSPCLFTTNGGAKDPSQLRFRTAIDGLRAISGVLFFLSTLIAFIISHRTFPDRPYLVTAATLFYAAIPTAIWRSVFVTNDNLVSLIGTAIAALALWVLTRKQEPSSLLALILGVSSGLGVLSKYNGVMMLAYAFLAILLRFDSPLKRRLVLSGITLVAFVATVSPDLLNNLYTDGDIFSREMTIQEASDLYSPQSALELLQDGHFVKTTIKRFWLTFHNTRGLDLLFPFWMFRIWWILLGIALCGWTIRIAKTRREEGRLGYFLFLSLLATAGCVLAFGTQFPLPEGRYAHPGLLIVVLIICIGISEALKTLLNTISNSGRYADPALTLIMFALLLLCHSTTYKYLSDRFSICRGGQEFSVPAGMEVLSGDISGDGIDEVLLFSRLRNRLFVKQFQEEDGNFTYSTVPEFTRKVVFMMDELMMGDVTGDGREDLIAWRRGNTTIRVLDSQSILSHNVNLSGFRDQSAHVLEYPEAPPEDPSRPFKNKLSAFQESQMFYIKAPKNAFLFISEKHPPTLYFPTNDSLKTLNPNELEQLNKLGTFRTGPDKTERLSSDKKRLVLRTSPNDATLPKNLELIYDYKTGELNYHHSS